MTRPLAFQTVLIANRGEIAVRVIRACRDAGLTSVAVFTDTDAGALHVAAADVAIRLSGSGRAGYLDAEALLAAAVECGADAIHPGYGFLSENAQFAASVEAAGLTWIGPPAAAIHTLGNKISARALARRVGAPIVAGTTEAVKDADEIEQFAKEHGLPLAIKAALGGGGRGLKVVRTLDEIPAAYESAVREAKSAFGEGACLVERYLDRARHVEVQILADALGNVVAVGTRDCSVQRRHQKLVEEAPAPFLTSAQEHVLTSAATSICRAAEYRGAGTVEFLLAADGTVSFLEVNTRLQVEHTVSEETSGIDLVREQFGIASGHPLANLRAPGPRGHAIEFRINAENAAQDFLPQPGAITLFVAPSGPGVRVDSGVTAGSVVSEQFDSLLAKLVVTGATREEAIERARRALDEMVVEGVTTVLDFHRDLLTQDAFIAVDGHLGIHTRWIETEWQPPVGNQTTHSAGRSTGRHHRLIMIGGRPISVSVPNQMSALPDEPGRDPTHSVEGGDATLLAPMQGTITAVAVANGDLIQAGDLVAMIEAMKMENPLRAGRAGTISELTVVAGSSVAQGTQICIIA